MIWGQKELRWLFQYVLFYGKRWKFLCENFYANRIKPENLIYQHKVVSSIIEEMISESERIQSGLYQLSAKTVYIYNVSVGFTYSIKIELLKKLNEIPQ